MKKEEPAQEGLKDWGTFAPRRESRDPGIAALMESDSRRHKKGPGYFAKAAAEKNTINAAAKDVVKRAEMELKNAENALALKTAIKICTEKKSTIKHLLKGDEETIFIDKNDTENIFNPLKMIL